MARNESACLAWYDSSWIPGHFLLISWSCACVTRGFVLHLWHLWHMVLTCRPSSPVTAATESLFFDFSSYTLRVLPRRSLLLLFTFRLWTISGNYTKAYPFAIRIGLIPPCPMMLMSTCCLLILRVKPQVISISSFLGHLSTTISSQTFHPNPSFGLGKPALLSTMQWPIFVRSLST